MSAISSLLLGCTIIVLLYSFLSFSYRSKVIVEGVSNIIGIDDRIDIIMGAHSWCTGNYSFERN